MGLHFHKDIKKLFSKNFSNSGRNFFGRITIRGRGDRNFRIRYKLVDFGRFLWNIPGLILSIHYDSSRNSYLGLVAYTNYFFSYILLPEKLFPGDIIISGENVKPKIGNSLLLKNIPFNTPIHNIELHPRAGGVLFRAAGCFGYIKKKNNSYAFIESNRNFSISIPLECSATIGRVSNKYSKYKRLRKAGQSRNLGFRPKVRGVAKNPVDHPHGGGEGKKSAKSLKMSPWGKILKKKQWKKKKKAYI